MRLKVSLTKRLVDSRVGTDGNSWREDVLFRRRQVNGKVVLVTGLPGSGKTTFLQELTMLFDPTTQLGFGTLIHDATKSTDPDITYDQLRTSPTRVAGPTYIDEARQALLQTVGLARASTNIFIDSHAVTADDYGFRVTPDSYAFLRQLDLDAILVLHVRQTILMQRLEQSDCGRRQVNFDQFDTYRQLQDSVCIAYAVVTGCPVFVLDANGSVRSTVDKARTVLDAIGMRYVLKDRS